MFFGKEVDPELGPARIGRKKAHVGGKKIIPFHRAEQETILETKTIEKEAFDEVFWSTFPVAYENTHL